MDVQSTYSKGEELIGVYRNSFDKRDENIVITTLGLRIFLKSKWVFICYEQINEIETLEKKISGLFGVFRTSH